MATQIANCIITPPNDNITILYVMTKAFNDLSLPGMSVVEGTDVKDSLVASIVEKTGIAIYGFEERTLTVPFEVGEKKFERLVFIANDHKGAPTTKGDLEKYGIEIHIPFLLFKADWKVKPGHKMAPGVVETIVRYYAGIPDFNERCHGFLPLNPDTVDEICANL